MMKKLAVKIAQYLMFLAGARSISIPEMSGDVLASARDLCAQAQKQDTSGEHKRAQVLRAMMNRHPDVSSKTLAMAIEVIVCGAA